MKNYKKYLQCEHITKEFTFGLFPDPKQLDDIHAEIMKEYCDYNILGWDVIVTRNTSTVKIMYVNKAEE